MRYLFTLLLIVIISFPSLSQRPTRGGARQGAPKLKGKLTGVLIDSLSSERLAFASVVVRNPKTDKDVNGIITDELGRFKITNIPIGTYNLLISFVGYETRTRQIKLTPKSPDLNLGTISISSSSTQLGAVVIEGEKEVIENHIDKIVYNADQDAANAGGDATDVLSRAPLVSVDIDGNPELRGNGNVRILINGKPSSMFAENPGDALKAIPADQIKSVEIITSPTAKYDGEGTAGIINIITKKKNVQGFAGTVNTSVGTRSNRLVLGLNAGTGRFGFNMSGSSYYSWPRNTTEASIRGENSVISNSLLSENAASEADRLGFRGSGGIFYDINAYHSLNSTFRIRGRRASSDEYKLSTYDDILNIINQRYESNVDNTNLRSGFEASLDYLIKFPDQDGRELIFAYKLDGNISDEEVLITQTDLLGTSPELFRDEQNRNDGDNRENTIQVDYTHPVGDKYKLELGGKFILRNVTSDSNYDSLNRNIGEYVTLGTSNIFDYSQNVMAAYISNTFNLGGGLGVVAGLRYENTDIEGNYNDGTPSFSTQYANLFPNLIVSKKLTKTNTLKASFGRRIQRPSLRYINPFIRNGNFRNIREGTPNINAEYTNQYELSYSTFSKGTALNTSLYFRDTDDRIESYLIINDEGVSVTNYRNVTANTIGINVFISTTFFKVWTLRGGLDVSRYSASSFIDGESISNNAIQWGGNGSSTLKLKNQWQIDLFAFYRAPRQTIQGFNSSFSIMSLGIKKTFWEKRASIGLRIVEPFFENKSFKNEVTGSDFFQMSERLYPFRSFGLSLSYKFGKLEFKQRERRTKIKNDDVGSDGGQQQEF